MSKTIYIKRLEKVGHGKVHICCEHRINACIYGQACYLLDMNMGMRDLDLYLGVQNEAIFDVYDVIMRTCEPRDASYILILWISLL